jgi:hypothetical protein
VRASSSVIILYFLLCYLLTGNCPHVHHRGLWWVDLKLHSFLTTVLNRIRIRFISQPLHCRGKIARFPPIRWSWGSRADLGVLEMRRYFSSNFDSSVVYAMVCSPYLLNHLTVHAITNNMPYYFLPRMDVTLRNFTKDGRIYSGGKHFPAGSTLLPSPTYRFVCSLYIYGNRTLVMLWAIALLRCQTGLELKVEGFSIR